MPRPVTRDQFDAFYDELAERLEGELRLDEMDRALYATDASLYRVEPLGVVIPATEEDVRTTVRMAAEVGIPLLPRGGGSSLAGQAVGAALVIDFSPFLDEIVEINALAGWVRVQPGVVLDHLNAAVKPHGFMVGPDPASSNRATIGGMMANNATGARSIIYGSFVDHIISARVLLADGSEAVLEPFRRDEWEQRAGRPGLEGALYRDLRDLAERHGDTIRRDTPVHWRRSGGYRAERLIDSDVINPAHLLCGSEGTLAVAVEVKLKLVKAPARTGLAVVHFGSRRLALEAVNPILETGPSAVELFDHVGIERCRQVAEYAHRLTFIEGEPQAVLIVEYFGKESEEIEARLAGLENVVDRDGLGYAVIRATDAVQIDNVWTVRKAGLGLVMGVKGDRKPVAFIEDAAVPVEHLPDYIEQLEALMAEENVEAAIYAHASAGCLHVRPFVNTKQAADVAKMKRLAVGSMELVRKFGGVISSEHGDGFARSWLNEQFFGEELYGVYRRIKSIFDPNGILNPGKVVDAPPFEDHWRMDPAYQTIDFVEEMDFSVDGGFARAVELCNGTGVCRKLDRGTMCPSFMVTRDEEDSTRGRANALREALSGRLPEGALTSKRTFEVMSLCIQCKACRAECPSAVDMAKIKTEWLHHYWQDNPMPRREKIFARMPDYFARSPGWARRVAKSGFARRFILGRLGIAPGRTLPAPVSETFTDWFAAGRRPTAGKRVVLFSDTFTNFLEPHLGKAAFELLTGIGYSVVVPEYRCCGRTYLSKGLIGEARKKAAGVIDLLAPYAEEGLKIIGMEPSCILSLRDEYPALFPEDDRTAALAEAAVTIEEFVEGVNANGGLKNIRWKKTPPEVMLHVHCHQRALSGAERSAQALALPGNTVLELDAGCCGMAGSFGYEAEHYDISIAMAERKLAPAVRDAPESTLIAAPGTSCRAQIEHTTGRKALHPVEVLRRMLD